VLVLVAVVAGSEIEVTDSQGSLAPLTVTRVLPFCCSTPVTRPWTKAVALTSPPLESLAVIRRV
jgi:hypothetical protein